MQTRRLSIADLAAAPVIGGGDLLGDGAAITSPVVLVDLDTASDVPADDVALAAVRASASDVILVGTSTGPIGDALGPLPEAVDLTYAPSGAGHRAVVGAGEVDVAVAAFIDAVSRCPLPPPAVDPVLLDRQGSILRITLNRPERRNAYGTALRDAFVDALRLAVLDDSIDHVVVDGAAVRSVPVATSTSSGTCPTRRRLI